MSNESKTDVREPVGSRELLGGGGRVTAPVLVSMKDITVKTGSETRCYCNECEQEWEVCLEPKFADMDYETAKRNGAGVRHIQFCPFCGSTKLEET